MRGLSQRHLTNFSRVLPALSAKRYEGHETGLRQRDAPAMASPVLHDAISLMQVNLLSVVQLQRHLPTNHDSVVYRIRRMHARSAAFEMVAHARNLLRHFSQPALESDARRRLPAIRALGRIRDEPKHCTSWAGKCFRPLEHRVGL